MSSSSLHIPGIDLQQHLHLTTDIWWTGKWPSPPYGTNCKSQLWKLEHCAILIWTYEWRGRALRDVDQMQNFESVNLSNYKYTFLLTLKSGGDGLRVKVYPHFTFGYLETGYSGFYSFFDGSSNNVRSI